MVDVAQNAFDNQGAGRKATVPPPEAQRSARPDRSEIWLPILGVIVVLASWEGVIRLFGMSEFVLPSPSAVAAALYEITRDGSLISNLLETLEEAALGFAIAVGAGIAIGGVMAQSPLIERMLYGYLVALQTMPKIALAPLFVAWFG